MRTEPLFWCVWAENGAPPTVKHPTFAKAKAEAQRLARAVPGQRFAVLAAAVAYVKRDVDEVRFEAAPATVWELDEEIPF